MQSLSADATIDAPAARPRRRSIRAIVAATGLVASLFVPAVIGSQPAGAALMTTTESSISHAIVLMLNAERALHGLRPLTTNYSLQLSARRHDKAMAAANTMSHQLPGEPDFATREERAGYNWVWAGENIAWNSNMSLTGVKQLESLMYNEKAPNNGHRLNILNSHFKNVGIDILMDTVHHKVWMTEDFGSLT